MLLRALFEGAGERQKDSMARLEPVQANACFPGLEKGV